MKKDLVTPKKPLETITKEKVQKYENVRRSGATNMYDIATVMHLSGLTRGECIDIMKHYDMYIKKFKVSRED